MSIACQCALQSTLPCTRNDIMMVDEYKQGVPTANMQVNKTLQMNTFQMFEGMNCIKSSLCAFRMLSEVCI